MPAPAVRPESPSMRFEEALPRLIATYEAGQLVPFLGAGMSIPACADWAYFIGNLERLANATDPGDDTDAAALVRRANRAVRALKLADPGHFPDVVSEALIGPRPGVPRQTRGAGEDVVAAGADDELRLPFHDAFRAAHPSRGPRPCGASVGRRCSAWWHGRPETSATSAR
jgi:hypothetical protein